MALGFVGRLLTTILVDDLLGELEDKGEKIHEISLPVSSTAIRAIGYRGSEDTGVITVIFNRGGAYDYEGNLDLFKAFAAAPSKGGFFNANFH